MDKAKWEREHAKARALQRYGLVLNRVDLIHVANLINSKKACFLLRSSNRVTLWQMEYKGKDMLIVFDQKRNQVITFLPLRFMSRIANKRFETRA